MLVNICYEKLHTTSRTHIAWIGIGRLFQTFTRHQLHTPDRFRYKRGIIQPASQHESFPGGSVGSYYQHAKMMPIHQVAGANAGWCWPFRFAVHDFRLGVAKLFSLGGSTRHEVTHS